MSNQQQEIMVRYEADGEEIKLTPSIVQQYIVGTDAQITLPEFKMFVSLCKARKLNPFLKECYCIKFGSQPAQIVVSKDVFLKRAILHPDYDGIEDGIIITSEKGEIIERTGCFMLPSETLVGGWAKVYRKNWSHPTYCSVSFSEVAQRKKDGSLNSNWQGKSATMVNKVAKVRALRETFVDEFAGMYEEAEITGQQIKPAEVEEPIIQQDEPSEVPQVAETSEEITFADI